MMNSWLEFQGLDLNSREGRRGTWEAKEILSVDSILFEGFSGGPTHYFLVTYHLLPLVERGRQEMCAFSWSHWYPRSIQESITEGHGRIDAGRQLSVFLTVPEAPSLLRAEAANRILQKAQWPTQGSGVCCSQRAFSEILHPKNQRFPRGTMVNNLPANQGTQVWSLGREDPLQKEMATHSSILAWRIPGTEEPGGLQSIGLRRVGHD